MYSPNGTGCRLTYCCPGPEPGVQTMLTLLSFPGGLSSTAPTSVGALVASTAAWIVARASACW